MIIGVPKEIKEDERRVGLTPRSVKALVQAGHEVCVERDAGLAIDMTDASYADAGALVVEGVEEVFERADLIVKVKEPQDSEVALLTSGQALFTYLHLAPDPALTNALLASDVVGIAYETVTDGRGRLPLLAPMSEIAGRMSIQAGAHCLEIKQGGRGVLLGGVPGTLPGKVVVIGAGVVGMNAARIALGMGAEVTIMDIALDRLAQLDQTYGPALATVFSTAEAVAEQVSLADLVVGAVLVPGSRTPQLVTERMVRDMKAGSVVVDVAIDQGGCIETSKPTTHGDPTFKRHDVVHYCVANMPGAVARTATIALNNATLPFVLALANKGINQALADDANLRAGLNVYQGLITHPEVAKAMDQRVVDPIEAMKSSRSNPR